MTTDDPVLVNIRRLAAELLGTFLLTLAATAPDVLKAALGTEFSPTIKAALPALAVALTIYAMGDVSGAHLNPAVTIAFWARRAFPLVRVPGYIAAQLAGASLAAGLLRWRYGPADDLGATRAKVDLSTALGCEVLLTFVLVVVILNVATRENLIGPQAAIPVAFAITIGGLLGASLSGGSMNPARSLGPAFVTGDLTDQWIYLVGPVVGGLLACAVTYLLHGVYSPDEKKAAQGEEPKASERGETQHSDGGSKPAEQQGRDREREKVNG